MAHALRDRSTPQALAGSRQVIEFKGRLTDFERLSAIVESELASLDAAERPLNWRNAPVSASLGFDFADARESLPRVRGAVKCALPAVCQRCLEGCLIEVSADVDYLLVAHGESVSEAAGYDAWELEEPAFRPSDLVEEVLVMSLPVSAMHADPRDCGALAERVGARDDAVAAVPDERSRPFANLRSLMTNKD